MNPIPANYTEFLYWLKDHTENYWSQDPKTSTNEDKCPEWAYGAKWIGMTDEQIDQVQHKYSITFTPEHREFLRILHTIDRNDGMYEDYLAGIRFYPTFFRNWLEDDEHIQLMLNAPYKDISADIMENRFWVNSWGKKPAAAEERMEIFNELYARAPKLVPVTGHRYQVAEMSLETRPVLSIIGTDIVYYGTNFRYYLLHEISEHLNISHLEYDPEDEVSYWVLNEEYKDDTFEYLERTKLPNIPFWKSFYLFDWTNHANNVNL